MTQYDKPDASYLANCVYEYISDNELNPWKYEERGVELTYNHWPIQLSDLITENTIQFDNNKICYTIDEWQEEKVEGYELQRINSNESNQSMYPFSNPNSQRVISSLTINGSGSPINVKFLSSFGVGDGKPSG